MFDHNNEEFRDSINKLKAWLAGRDTDSISDKITVTAPDGLRSIGFLDLVLEKCGPQHSEEIVYCYDGGEGNQKPAQWTELCHLVKWSTELMKVLENNKSSLAALDMLSGENDYPISVAKFHVNESVAIIKSALNFESALDVQHPDTRARNYAATNILIEDSNRLHDIVRQVFSCLYSKSVVRLIVKHNQFYSATLVAFLVDLMHLSGATKHEVSCVSYNIRESIGNERFSKCLTPNKNSKLSVISIVFKKSDTFAAAQGIIETYFREQYPNLVVLVEESVYERFVKDWQRYYSHAVHIGSRLDECTTIVESFNNKVTIDLDAIDIKSAHKMNGNVINVLRFRTSSELLSQLNQLRKIPYMTIWNDDILMARELSLRINISNDFWINHVPKSLSGQKFPYDMLNYYANTVTEDMVSIYNSIYSQYSDEAEQLRKVEAAFSKKSFSLRTSLILQSFISIISKSKSLKNGGSIGECVAQLRRFQRGCLQRISASEPGQSRIEAQAKPVGLALVLVRNESANLPKAVLLEFIFKNLLVGNAVLLICPPNTLGAKFVFENDHIIPFKMVHESLPDVSRLSLDEVEAQHESSISKKLCPKNTYAIEFMADVTGEACETVLASLGVHSKRIWYPDEEVTNYWKDE